MKLSKSTLEIAAEKGAFKIGACMASYLLPYDPYLPYLFH